MALTFAEATYAGRTIDVYEIDTDQFILEGFLDSRDQKIIADAVAGDGVDTELMPNGQGTVLEYYGPLARTAEELEAQYNRYAITSDLVGTITAIQAELAE